MYHYTKIRGYKVTSIHLASRTNVVRFLPNEVYLLEPVLEALSTPNLQWQTTYVLLLWLSLICLAPFDLASIESSNGRESLVTRLLVTAKRGLGSGGKERDACAILCARILSRGDVWRVELQPFMTWAIKVFSSPEDNILLVYPENFYLTKKTGLLSTISNILTHSERQVGQSIISEAMEILRLTESDKIQSSALARKLRVKIMQKVGIIEIGRSNLDIEVPESLENVLDFLLSSISDKVTPHHMFTDEGYNCTIHRSKSSLPNRVISPFILFKRNNINSLRENGRRINQRC